MRKIGLGILFAVVLITLTVGVASALPANKGREVKAPPLTKIVFIRYAPGFKQEKPCNNDGVCNSDEKGWCSDCKSGGEEAPTTACYDFLAGSKPRWNWVENYVYDDESLAIPSFDAVTTWEAPVSGDIFGVGDYVTGYNWGAYDYTNSISFGDYNDPNVIAVTAIWFRGKNIYEYDIMFDTDYFPGDGSVNLATVVLHEFGHGAGLGDLYDTVCVSEVMYGIYDEVDLDLGPDDITGIRELYGE